MVEEADDATASRGVKGVFAGAVRLLASVGFSGRELFRSGRSMGILHGIGVIDWDIGGGCRGRSWPAGGEAMLGLLAKGGVDDGC